VVVGGISRGKASTRPVHPCKTWLGEASYRSSGWAAACWSGVL